MHLFKENYNMDNWSYIGWGLKKTLTQHLIIIRFFKSPCFLNIIIIGTQQYTTLHYTEHYENLKLSFVKKCQLNIFFWNRNCEWALVNSYVNNVIFWFPTWLVYIPLNNFQLKMNLHWAHQILQVVHSCLL